MGKRQSLGKWGERVAENFLASKGYTIISRNFRTPYGEIDLIAEAGSPDDRMIVFCEVKTRTTKSFGPPEEAVNSRKIAHFMSAAQYYMQQNPSDVSWRLDVIAVEQITPGRDPEIIHFENAISE